MIREMILLGAISFLASPSLADQLHVGRRMTGLEFDVTGDQRAFSPDGKSVVFVFASW
jgi:hypothetical protein